MIGCMDDLILFVGQESLTTKFVLRKKSSPERSTDQRPPWSLTASDKQNEWKIKYGVSG